MLRATGTSPASPLDPSAPYYGIFATPGNGIVVQWRATEGASTNQVALPTGTVPTWLEIARWTSGGTTPITYYTAYTSPDGVTWTAVPGSTEALALPGPLTAALAVTSHSSTLSTATFTSIVVTATELQPASVCPTTMICTDYDSPAIAGNQSESGTTWTVQASGSDIWGTTDQFRYVASQFTGNTVMSTQVSSLTNASPSPWAKAGLMVRLPGDASAPNYTVLLTPGNGIVVQDRLTEGGTTNQVATLPGVTGVYLQLTVVGDTFVAATSSNGTTWTTIPGSSVTISALTGSLQGGLAVTSHDNSNLVSAVFWSTVL